MDNNGVKFRCGSCGKPTNNDRIFTLPSGTEYHLHTCDKCAKRIHLEVEWESIGEHYREDEIICPYCECSYDDYDAWKFDEGKSPEVECEFCGKKFDLEVVVRRKYTTKRSICEMPDDFDPEKYEEE